jgi:predicted Zn-dependent protease
MREKVRVMTSANLRELIKTYEDKLKENTTEDQSVTRYGYALALLKNSNYTQARDEINDLIDLDDNQLSYHLVLADIEIALGRMDAALAIYNDFQRVYPDDWALSIKQVQALLRANEPRKAIYTDYWPKLMVIWDRKVNLMSGWLSIIIVLVS